MKLQTKNLSLTLAQKIIFSGINVTFEHHQIYCLLGENGSGKSSLLKCLSGRIPTQNSIFLNGEKIESHLQNNTLSQSLIYLPQELHRADNFTCKEFVGAAFMKNIFSNIEKTDSVKYKMEEALNTWSLETLKNKPLASLSGGEWKRTQLAHTFVRNPPFILLDEPDSHLDWKHIELLTTQIKKHSSQNKTVIVTTHNWDFATQVGTQVGILNHGSLEWVRGGSEREELKLLLKEKLL